MSRRDRGRKPLERIQTPVAPRTGKRTRFSSAIDLENQDRPQSTPKCKVCNIKDASENRLCVDCIATDSYIELAELPEEVPVRSTSTHQSISSIVEETALERLQRENSKLSADNGTLHDENIKLKSQLEVAQRDLIDSKERNARVSLLYDCVYADSLRMEAKIKELLQKLGEPAPDDESQTKEEGKQVAAKLLDSSPEKDALTRRDTLTELYLSEGN